MSVLLVFHFEPLPWFSYWNPTLLETGPPLFLQGLKPVPSLLGISATSWAAHQPPAPPRLCPSCRALKLPDAGCLTPAENLWSDLTSASTPTTGQHGTLPTHHPLAATLRLAGHACAPAGYFLLPSAGCCPSMSIQYVFMCGCPAPRGQ